jgi:hypothetical protein
MTQRYLASIRYGNTVPYRGTPLADDQWHFEVLFDYGDRDLANPRPADALPRPARLDPFSQHKAGFEVRTYRLCRRVLMLHHFAEEAGVGRDCLVRSLHLRYSELDGGDSERGHRLGAQLASLTLGGHRREGAAYATREFPPIELEYSVAGEASLGEIRTEAGELYVDGLTSRWVDLDGEGIPGVATVQGGQWHYAPNLGGGRLATPHPVAAMPNTALHLDQLTDLDGDGRSDLLLAEQHAVSRYERDDEGAWGTRRTLSGAPNTAWRDPNLTWVDLTGDGHSDLLRTEGENLTWWRSLRSEGFTAPEQVTLGADERDGPRVLFSDATQLVQLADMSGDGHPDIVRIRNGEVCYWPYEGYGRFGRRVTMAGAPLVTEFHPAHLRLADIDGTGTTDVIYLEGERVALYANECGNAFSAPRLLQNVPRSDSVTAVGAVDVLGMGTTCLVWSTPLPEFAGRSLRYLDLVGGSKPRLLTGIRNNLGASTRLTHAPSTSFYLADRAAGQEWVTRLPFPVYVIAEVMTEDAIGRSRLVTTYRYRHGYFDPVDREFRGFGRVGRSPSPRTSIRRTPAPRRRRSAGSTREPSRSASSRPPPCATSTFTRQESPMWSLRRGASARWRSRAGCAPGRRARRRGRSRGRCCARRCMASTGAPPRRCRTR